MKCCFFQNTGDICEQLWQIIIRLNSNSQKYIHLLQDIYHKENLRLTVEQWIDQSVITQCLSQQLFCIENDLDLLEYYYYSKKLIEILFFFYYSPLIGIDIHMMVFLRIETYTPLTPTTDIRSHIFHKMMSSIRNKNEIFALTIYKITSATFITF